MWTRRVEQWAGPRSCSNDTPTSLIQFRRSTQLSTASTPCQNPEVAVLALTSVNPACGSAFSLIAEAGGIAERVARIRNVNPESDPRGFEPTALCGQSCRNARGGGAGHEDAAVRSRGIRSGKIQLGPSARPLFPLVRGVFGLRAG